MSSIIDSISGIHIEPTNICTLKCAGCARTLFIDQWPQHWKNHSIDIDRLMFFLDFDISNKKILLCGNYGDPIYHPDFIDLVRKLKQRLAKIVIITNGSYKKAQWWTELTNLMDSTDEIIFSIDGTPENFIQYRENANWESIKTAIDICTKSSCKTVWKFIPFSFNQTDIDHVQAYSKSLGIDSFVLDHSDRFVDVPTQHLQPAVEFLGQRYQAQAQWHSTQTISKFDPKCANGTQHFISADGFYSPCCFLADHRFYYKTQFGKQKKQYDIQEHTLLEILQQPSVIEFYQNIEQTPGCQFNCPG
jgi:MoaA/NifB/PqqE/SkfB family radical SAM enzyme